MGSILRCVAWALAAVLWTILPGTALALRAPPALAVTWVLICLVVFSRLYLWRRDPTARLALWQSFRLIAAPVPLSWLALTAVATTSLSVSCALLFGVSNDSSGTDLFEQYLALPGGFAFIAFMALVYAPVVEEAIFRGRLLSILEPSPGRLGAIVITAALFAALHGGQLGGILARFAFGLGAGAAVVATGSLWAAIAMHVVNNGVVLLFLDSAEPTLGAPYAALAVVLSSTSLAFALRGLAQGSRAA